VGPVGLGKTKEMETRIRDSLKFLAYAPIVFTSAKDGRGLAIVLKTALRVYQASKQRVATGPLNRALAEAAARHPPKAAKGNKSLRILFATQIGAQPPTFVLSLNHAVELALFLPALPREPAAGRLRVRGLADRAAGARQAPLTRPSLLLTSIELTHTMLEISSVSSL
jgi:hypothetical protein